MYITFLYSHAQCLLLGKVSTTNTLTEWLVFGLHLKAHFLSIDCTRIKINLFMCNMSQTIIVLLYFVVNHD